MVRSAVQDRGNLIRFADPDASSNPSKQEIEMKKQQADQEIKIAATADFETILTIRELQTPNDLIELKFETVFAGAKDPQSRQIKAQFFIETNQLHGIALALSNLHSS